MKKIFLFFALIPLGLMAKCPPSFDTYKATQDFEMRVTNPKKETIAIKKDAGVLVRSKTELATQFTINTQRYETSNEEFDSHVKNGDLVKSPWFLSNDDPDEPVNPDPEPESIQVPLLH